MECSPELKEITTDTAKRFERNKNIYWKLKGIAAKAT